jgi:hypothetical protein
MQRRSPGQENFLQDFQTTRQTSEAFCPSFEEFLGCSPQDHLLWLVEPVAMEGNIMMNRALFVFWVAD